MNGTYFDPVGLGFYPEDSFPANKRPAGCVYLTKEEEEDFFENQLIGLKEVAVGPGGKPIAVDPPPPSVEEKAKRARASRDALLANTDWVVIKSLETGQPVPPEWATYRQALRDITKQPGFPLEVVWPEAPE